MLPEGFGNPSLVLKHGDISRKNDKTFGDQLDPFVLWMGSRAVWRERYASRCEVLLSKVELRRMEKRLSMQSAAKFSSLDCLYNVCRLFYATHRPQRQASICTKTKAYIKCIKYI